jgi:hypothetical protein
LLPSTITGHLKPFPGDPVVEVLARTRRLIGALATLETEPPPRLLSAPEIRALLAMTLDPVRAQAHPLTLSNTIVRPLQLASAHALSQNGARYHGHLTTASLGPAS